MGAGSDGERRRGPRFATIAGAAITASLAAAAPALSQTPAAASGPSADDGIPTLVVTAQRRSENIQDVPVAIQAISAKDLLSEGIKSTQDLGQITPNVTIVSPIGAGNQPLITIRGIGLNDFDTNNSGPNGIYVDDVYISAPSSQDFALFDVSQVEVLKGPQGTLYGRNTSGGAILFTSNKPTDTFTSDAHVEYGNFNTLQLEGAVGGPIASGVDGRLSGVYNYSDGFMRNVLDNKPVSGTNNGALRGQLLYKPTDRLKVYFETTVGYLYDLPEEYRHVGTFVPGTQNTPSPTLCSPSQAAGGGCVDLAGYGTLPGFYDGEYNRKQKLRNFNLINQLRLDYKVGDVTLTSVTSTQYNDKFHPEDSDAGPDSLVNVNYGVTSQTYTQEFRAAASADHYNWVAGAFYLHENLRQNQPLFLFLEGDQSGGFGVPPGDGAFDGIAQHSLDDSKQITDSEAVYGQGDYALGKLTLTLGGRYTWEQKSFNYFQETQYQLGGTGNFGPYGDVVTDQESQSVSNFTYRAALTYHFTPKILSYGSIATGFKSGDFNGSFLSNVPSQALFQLKPVAPEHVTTYEIGEKGSFFGQKLILNAAVFYNDYRDEQIFATVPQELQTAAGSEVFLTQILSNAKKAETEGVEFELIARPVSGLTIDLQPAWLNGVLDDAGLPLFTGATSLNGKQLANAPHVTFSAVVDYRYALPGGNAVDVRLNSNYRSHEWFDSTNDPYIQQNAYWIHNLNIEFQSHDGWAVGAFVRNLTGTKYALTSTDESSPFGILTPVIGSPCTYGVELSYHY